MSTGILWYNSQSVMSVFHRLLLNSLITVTKNNFVWFALTYFLYLQTQSVMATSIFGGLFLVVNALTSMWFGSLVDHYKKKTILITSNLATLVLFIAGFALYLLMSEGGAGAHLISSWYGVGAALGMVILFSLAGVLGLVVTSVGMRSNAYV